MGVAFMGHISCRYFGLGFDKPGSFLLQLKLYLQEMLQFFVYDFGGSRYCTDESSLALRSLEVHPVFQLKGLNSFKFFSVMYCHQVILD